MNHVIKQNFINHKYRNVQYLKSDTHFNVHIHSQNKLTFIQQLYTIERNISLFRVPFSQ